MIFNSINWKLIIQGPQSQTRLFYLDFIGCRKGIFNIVRPFSETLVKHNLFGIAAESIDMPLMYQFLKVRKVRFISKPPEMLCQNALVFQNIDIFKHFDKDLHNFVFKTCYSIILWIDLMVKCSKIKIGNFAKIWK